MVTLDNLTAIEALHVYADHFLRNNYNMELEIPIKRNNRLKRVLGRFTHRVSHKEPVKIDLSGVLLDHGHPEIVIDILKHELIHYALYMKDRDHKDGDYDFENDLRKHHSSSTRSFHIGKHDLCQCRGCNREFESKLTQKMKSQSFRYRTKCCAEPFDVIGSVIHDGTGDTKTIRTV